MTEETDWKPETLAAQALGWEDQETGAVVPPIHLSTTFARDAENYETPDGRTYIRTEGWSQEHAEAVIRTLEGGAAAMVFGSGLAACTAPLHGLQQGDRVAMSRTVYHGVLRFAEVFLPGWGIGVDYFDSGDLDGLARAVTSGETRLVWVETPANPTWAVTDIAAAAEIAHGAEARLAVDSTAATPVLTRPLELGADLVCHSATKFLNGHSDVIAGAVVAKEDDEFWQRLQTHRYVAGPLLGSFEAYLLVRGMRTLFLRVRRQSENALAVARFLESHPGVERVHYPGLESDPGHAVARRQMRGGFGGMLSFLVPGGRNEAIGVVKRASVFKRATSLGGVESLIEHRKTSENELTSTPENLIRVSIGIEDVSDLIGDLKTMLAGH